VENHLKKPPDPIPPAAPRRHFFINRFCDRLKATAHQDAPRTHLSLRKSPLKDFLVFADDDPVAHPPLKRAAIIQVHFTTKDTIAQAAWQTLPNHLAAIVNPPFWSDQ
jgi:hypothetical protein